MQKCKGLENFSVILIQNSNLTNSYEEVVYEINSGSCEKFYAINLLKNAKSPFEHLICKNKAYFNYSNHFKENHNFLIQMLRYYIEKVDG